MEKTDVVEDFYGVYLLKCLNPKYKGWTYIGYTVDPNRRIKQHNKGKLYGGAWKTSKKGPWEMMLTVHGFPSEVAALRFEWAWQHPTKSRRLKAVIAKKKVSESMFEFCLKVLFTMLRVPPWCRLPLTIRWLAADMVEMPPNLAPPMHMPIVYGPVISKKVISPKKKPKTDKNLIHEEDDVHICKLCHDLLDEKNSLTCLKNSCQGQWHILCLGTHFLSRESSFVGTLPAENKSGNVLPVEGCCTECGSAMLWGDLVKKRKGCYSQVTRIDDDSVLNSSGC